MTGLVRGVATTSLALGLGLVLVGCGSTTPVTQPTPSPSVTMVTTPTTSPSPTPTPLSPFEGRPQVKVLRLWAAAAARDVNARSHQLKRAQRYELPSAYTAIAYIAHEEFDKYYPGPFPFTPVSVTGTGPRSVVTACIWSGGFALNHKGGRPATKHQVIGISFTMRKALGAWKLAADGAATADCSGVTVKGVQW